MRIVLLALLAAALAPPAIGSFHDALVSVADREFVLVMQGTSINGFHAPDAPLLEAYLGERVRFTVLATEPHTFHLHGHPWLLADGRVVDTFLVDADTPHAFDVKAGGVDGHAGDWMYHCHIEAHVDAGMWGVFRVHPYSVALADVGPETTVRLARLGVPVDGASLALAVEGAPVEAHVEALGGGVYRVHADLPASGELTVTATHALGESLARASLDATPLDAPALKAVHHA